MIIPPRINWLAFDPEELPSGRLLDLNLSSLLYLIEQFKHAVALADYCDEQRAPYKGVLVEFDKPETFRARELNSQFIKWKQLAARDGVITLNNYAETKQTIEKLKGRCPNVLQHIDKDAAKQANALFRDSFPDLADVRLSVAHAGKLFKSEEENDKHTVPGSKARISGMQTDRHFASSINGKVAAYSLTNETADILTRVTELIYKSYEPAADFTQTLPHRPPPDTPELREED